MRHVLLFLAVAWTCALLPALAQGPASEHAPAIACDEPTFNFGEKDNNQEVEHTFVVRNAGDLTLEIGTIRPTCGCTVASVSRNQVPPGETAELTAKLSLRGRQGPQHKTISVQSNDPKTPTLTLVLEGTAVAELRVTPTQIFFGRVTTDAAVTGTVEIVLDTTNVVTVTKAESDSPNLGVVTEPSPDGKRYRLLVATRPPLPRGTLRASVGIETDHPRYPSMSIPVSAFVVGAFAFAPEEFSFAEETGTPVQRYVIIRSELGKKFEVLSVEPPSPSIQANIAATEEAAYRIDLSNIMPTRDLDGKVLRIKLNADGEKEILIPFHVAPAQPLPAPGEPAP